MAKINKTTQHGVQDGKNWYRDRYESVVTQRNFFAVIALTSLGIALLAGMIILFLAPVKTVAPFLIQVDEKSGLTQVIDVASQKEITADEAMRKYFVAKFVQARESYDTNDNRRHSNIIRLFAVRDLYRGYWEQVISRNNKASLFFKLGDRKVRRVRINSIQFLDGSLAQVRFSTTDSTRSAALRGEQKKADANFIALVGFNFTKLDLTPDEMRVNPLGFRVTSYRVDDEVL